MSLMKSRRREELVAIAERTTLSSSKRLLDADGTGKFIEPDLVGATVTDFGVDEEGFLCLTVAKEGRTTQLWLRRYMRSLKG